jgi:hypothetical protein
LVALGQALARLVHVALKHKEPIRAYRPIAPFGGYDGQLESPVS